MLAAIPDNKMAYFTFLYNRTKTRTLVLLSFSHSIYEGGRSIEISSYMSNLIHYLTSIFMHNRQQNTKKLLTNSSKRGIILN